ncbi:MAG: DUF2891 domain-containing protein [Pseudomonadota bacterium]|nr:DUF2891 domain-containing protein [Pseudomonadota bacterium]
MTLTRDTAARFAALTLGHLGQQYPYKLDLVLTGPADVTTPIALHPIFHGSFDWHSCVHGWWQVMRIARRFPDLDVAAAVRERGDAILRPELVAGEIARLDRPYAAGFERPYGWAWALMLHHELAQHDAQHWAAAVEPLARRFAAMFAEHLPKLTYPIRTGTHFNTAFALTLARTWAVRFDPALTTLIDQRAHDWFGSDRGCQAWEPGGDEFLSSALCEAMLMTRVMDRVSFVAWFDCFLPDAAAGRPASLFTPAHVSDRSDGKIAHLDGTNLSRAWCWEAIADALGDAHPVVSRARETAARHLDVSLPHIADDYMGTHWLATFALLALDRLD